MRAQTAWVLLFVASMALGAGEQAPPNENPAMKELTPCFVLADRTRVAAHLVNSGQPKEALEARLTAALAEAPPAELELYKAALGEALAEKPADPGAYVAKKLDQCVAATSSRNKQHIARPCYEVTLHATEIYAAKQQGMALDKVKTTGGESLAKAGKSTDYVKSVQNMATAIYGIDQPEVIFRARWFASCVIQSK